jgi:hypothetical protein
MYDSYLGFWTLRGVADRYQVRPDTVRKLADKLNLGQQRLGRNRLFTGDELKTLEVGLVTLNYSIPENLPPIGDLVTFEKEPAGSAGVS